MTRDNGDATGSNPSWARKLSGAVDAVEKLDARIRDDWSTVPDRRVQAACDDVALVAEFVYRSLPGSEVGELIDTALRGDPAYVEAFARIHSTVDDFGACMIAIDEVGLPEAERSGQGDHLIERLTGLANALRHDLEKVVEAFVAVVERTTSASRHSKERATALQIAQDVSRQLKARKLYQQTERALAKRVRADREQAAGDEKIKQLGDYYADYAEKETTRADRLRIVVAGLLVFIACGAVTINIRLEPTSLAAELLRLSAAVPIALLAGYLTRESSKHRSSAKWAHELAIEMYSLPAYADSLGDTGVDLRRAFGMRVFGTGVEQPDQSTEDGLFHEVGVSVRRLLELIESRGKSQ